MRWQPRFGPGAVAARAAQARAELGLGARSPLPNPKLNIPARVFCMSWQLDFEFRGARRSSRNGRMAGPSRCTLHTRESAAWRERSIDALLVQSLFPV